MTSLVALRNAGQSPWLDYIRRGSVRSGELVQQISQGILGVTSNQTIFEKAIVGSKDYDEGLRALLSKDPSLPASVLYERLAVEDVREAADLLRPVFDRTGGEDGYVSLEVAPGLEHDVEGTVRAAHHLWDSVGRPNVMIKVPSTKEGAMALERLVGEGIPVNATLLFSRSQYEAVAQAYLRGRSHSGTSHPVASVASLFVSRVDAAVARELDGRTDPRIAEVKGKVAVAYAKGIYQRYREIFASGPSGTAGGGRPQRILWASVSMKDPSGRDTYYVEGLIGPQTVITIPPRTLSAFEDHGILQSGAVESGLEEAQRILRQTEALGVELEPILERLQVEGLADFAESYRLLLEALEAKRRKILTEEEDPLSLHLGTYSATVEERLKTWGSQQVSARLWHPDPSLWPAAPAKDVRERTGWLHLPADMQEELTTLERFADEVRQEGTKHIVLLGMGGSSLAPKVFQGVFGSRPGFPSLAVLDSTHPLAVRSLAASIDPAAALFLVSSKSGTTLETLSFYRYFREKVGKQSSSPDHNFVAITDAGTPLSTLATEQGFRKVFHAVATVGGRYSALTHFGLVPAALTGVDVRRVLGQAWAMAEGCAACVPPEENPGIRLGAALGELALHGRDKLTLYGTGRLAAFPVWLEQLFAESTGKNGRGILPVVDEPLAGPECYGPDRVFVSFSGPEGGTEALESHLSALETAGHPVVRVRLSELANLGQEFFRWEVAVALSGTVLGIDPYDQPDVELAKQLARKAMDASPGKDRGEAVRTVPVNEPAPLRSAFQALMGTTHAGDYIALQAFLPPEPSNDALLQGIRRDLLLRYHLATTVGYGPRFLHSTGQLHKGGPPTGVFLQIVDPPGEDEPVPGENYSFGQIVQAQSVGDYLALQSKGRRILRIDIGRESAQGLGSFRELLHG